MKRILALICAALLAMLAPAALAEKTLVAYTGDSAVMFTDSGVVLTNPGDYPEIYSIGNDDLPREKQLFAYVVPDALHEVVYGYATDDGYEDYVETVYSVGLMDSAGKELTPCEYNLLTHYPDAGRVVGLRDDGTADVLDEQGNVLFNAPYDVILPTSPDSYLAAAAENTESFEDWDFSEGELTVLDAEGNATGTGYTVAIYSLGGFSEGVVPVMAYDPKGDGYVYRYFDAAGRVVIPGPFLYAESFHDGRAIASSVETGRYGLLDIRGNWTLKPEYEYVFTNNSLENAPYIAQTGDASIVFYDHDTLAPFLTYEGPEEEYAWASQIDESILSVQTSETELLYDTKGNLLNSINVTDGYFNTYYSFCDGAPGAFTVASGNYPQQNYRIVTLDGETLADGFQEVLNLRWRDGHGLYVFSTFETTEFFYDDGSYLGIDYDTYRMGLMDETGAVLVPARFISLYALTADRLWAMDENVCGMIDEHGNWYFQLPVGGALD